MIRSAWLLLTCAVLGLGSGCALMQPHPEPPVVTVSSFRALPTDGLAPRFEIRLHVVNPNRAPLELQGIAYSVSLEGHRVITGVANELPPIAGYGEGEVVLRASVGLLNSMRLISDLMQQPRETFAYAFEARLDVGALRPDIRVHERGAIDLRALP